MLFMSDKCKYICCCFANSYVICLTKMGIIERIWLNKAYLHKPTWPRTKNQPLKTICACSSWKEENLRIQPILEKSTLIGCYASKYADKNIFIHRILWDFESHSWQRLPNVVTNVFKGNIIIFHRLCVGLVGTSANTTVHFHRHRRTFSTNTRISHI